MRPAASICARTMHLCIQYKPNTHTWTYCTLEPLAVMLRWFNFHNESGLTLVRLFCSHPFLQIRQTLLTKIPTLESQGLIEHLHTHCCAWKLTHSSLEGPVGCCEYMPYMPCYARLYPCPKDWRHLWPLLVVKHHRNTWHSWHGYVSHCCHPGQNSIIKNVQPHEECVSAIFFGPAAKGAPTCMMRCISAMPSLISSVNLKRWRTCWTCYWEMAIEQLWGTAGLTKMQSHLDLGLRPSGTCSCCTQMSCGIDLPGRDICACDQWHDKWKSWQNKHWELMPTRDPSPARVSLLASTGSPKHAE